MIDALFFNRGAHLCQKRLVVNLDAGRVKALGHDQDAIECRKDRLDIVRVVSSQSIPDLAGQAQVALFTLLRVGREIKPPCTWAI